MTNGGEPNTYLYQIARLIIGKNILSIHASHQKRLFTLACTAMTDRIIARREILRQARLMGRGQA